MTALSRIALILTAVCAACLPHAAAQTPGAPISSTMTARDAGSAQWFFAMAPDDVLPLLPPNTRLDMLDYYNSGLARPSRNAAGGEAVITASDSRRLAFQLGDSTTCELAVFTAGPDTLVALVETIRFPMADSSIQWFDAQWQPVRPPLSEPTLADWLTRDGRRRRAEAEEALPFMTAEATTDPAQGTITLTRTIDSYFLPGTAPEALSLTHPALVYRLSGRRFVLK